MTEHDLKKIAKELKQISQLDNSLDIEYQKKKNDLKIRKKENLLKYKELKTDKDLINRVKSDSYFNNLLVEVFPNDFTIQKIVVRPNINKSECNRLIKKIDQKTMKKEKYICHFTSETEKGLKIHVANHKKKDELM